MKCSYTYRWPETLESSHSLNYHSYSWTIPWTKILHPNAFVYVCVNAFNETRINWLKACSFLLPLILPSVLLVVHATRCVYATNVCSLTIHIGFVSCWCSPMRLSLSLENEMEMFRSFHKRVAGQEEFDGSKENDRYRRYFNHGPSDWTDTRRAKQEDQLIDVQSFIPPLFSVVLSLRFSSLCERPRRRRRWWWWWWWWTMFISTCDCQSSWSS